MDGKSAKSQLKKCAADTNQLAADDDVDWISQLPDDILIGILSSLPLKEAARTGILSSRWENLWKHTSRLDFNADYALDKIAQEKKEKTAVLTTERRKYISWVSKVLRSHKGFALKEFKICFDLDKHSKKAINNWLRHAFERRVERLELDLSVDGDMGRQLNVFPIKQFTLHQAPRRCFDFRSLRWLFFKSVGVTDQDIHFFLRSCPLLEHLVVKHSSEIRNLKICGALALKHLEISWCDRLKSIKVSAAPNLTSLKVSRLQTLLLENVPKLAEVYVVNFWLHEHLPKLVPTLHCCLSQLEILSLDLVVLEDGFLECNFPVLAKLKKLEIKYFTMGDKSMFALTSLLRAAPYCQEFVIRMIWYKILRTDENVKKETHSPHQHLKLVKFLGYYGRSSDVELVRYLLDNCVVLEKLIIDPRYQTVYSHIPICPAMLGEETPETNYPQSTQVDELDAERTARKYAKRQLEGQIPQHIQLLIL